MRFVVAIAHAAFAPGRKESLARVLAQLVGLTDPPAVFASTEPEHASTWARRVWAWAAARDKPTVILNDDVQLAPGFALSVSALLDADLDAPISLHAQGKDAARLARSGHHVLRFYDYTGPGVILAPSDARSLLAWWDAHPEMRHVKGLNEDNVATQWAWSRQRPFVATLPALVRHDVAVPSTLGYDAHADRVTSVAWDEPWWPADTLDRMTRVDYWRGPEVGPIPLIENPWFSSRHLDLLHKRRRGLLPDSALCAFCRLAPGAFASTETGASICLACAQRLALAAGFTPPVRRHEILP